MNLIVCEKNIAAKKVSTTQSREYGEFNSKRLRKANRWSFPSKMVPKGCKPPMS